MSNVKFLKDLYKDYFKIGVACESIHDRFTNNEIGNKEKEALISKQFESITFGNELKPMYNMGYDSPEAKEDYLPFVINPNAKTMLDWAVENNMPVRGHVLIWHSQCPKEAFCKEYKPVTIPTDPEILKERPMMKMFEKLDPVCFVDRETMKKRMESYIFSLMEYMYKNGYAKVLYAWDVVNEALELNDKTPTGLRNSYWYQVVGEDFMYWAFLYAKQAVVKYSKMYADQYGKKPEEIQFKLFYNDYNEFQPEKKKAIIDALERETDEHGSIIGEGLIDGIGMQGHLSDNNDIDEYMVALKDYAAKVSEVHITELDVKCTCTNANQEYYQAVFYKEFFEKLIEAKKEGNNLTLVTFWGLTDDNSWIRGANPLLFHKDLSAKKAFDALVYAALGGDLGKPERIIRNLSDRKFDFEKKVEPETIGFKPRAGMGRIEICDHEAHSGKYCIANEFRFGDWTGIAFDISDFIGQTIDVSAWVKSPALKVKLFSEVGDPAEFITAVDTTSGEWTQISARYKVPMGMHSLYLSFGTEEETPDKFSAIYADDIEIKLVGQEESFEGETNIAAIRGMGHLPVLMTTDKESVSGTGKSLQVIRQEKDATVKFDVSAYIGKKIDFSLYVKCKDKVARIGLDGSVPKLMAETNLTGGWDKISAEIELPEDLRSAEIYLETDGNAEMFVDEVFVKLA